VVPASGNWPRKKSERLVFFFTNRSPEMQKLIPPDLYVFAEVGLFGFLFAGTRCFGLVFTRLARSGSVLRGLGLSSLIRFSFIRFGFIFGRFRLGRSVRRRSPARRHYVLAGKFARLGRCRDSRTQA
jgi:hypothetical protein